MSESVDVSGFSVLLYTKNRGVHRLLPMDFRLREPGIVEQSLQLFWCIGGHALHEVRPLGIGINYFDHDGKTSTRLQHPVNALHTAWQIRPEIDRLDGRHKVERPFFVKIRGTGL